MIFQICLNKKFLLLLVSSFLIVNLADHPFKPIDQLVNHIVHILSNVLDFVFTIVYGAQTIVELCIGGCWELSKYIMSFDDYIMRAYRQKEKKKRISAGLIIQC